MSTAVRQLVPACGDFGAERFGLYRHGRTGGVCRFRSMRRPYEWLHAQNLRTPHGGAQGERSTANLPSIL
jgi:hypothetical protein